MRSSPLRVRSCRPTLSLVLLLLLRLPALLHQRPQSPPPKRNPDRGKHPFSRCTRLLSAHRKLSSAVQEIIRKKIKSKIENSVSLPAPVPWLLSVLFSMQAHLNSWPVLLWIRAHWKRISMQIVSVSIERFDPPERQPLWHERLLCCINVYNDPIY